MLSETDLTRFPNSCVFSLSGVVSHLLLMWLLVLHGEMPPVVAGSQICPVASILRTSGARCEDFATHSTSTVYYCTTFLALEVYVSSSSCQLLQLCHRLRRRAFLIMCMPEYVWNIQYYSVWLCCFICRPVVANL